MIHSPVINATRGAKWFGWIFLIVFLPLPLKAVTYTPVGRVIKIRQNQIIVQIVGDHAPVAGDIGLVRSVENPIGKVRVLKVEKNIFIASIPAHTLAGRPKIGDKIYFQSIYPLPSQFVRKTESQTVKTILPTSVASTATPITPTPVPPATAVSTESVPPVVKNENPPSPPVAPWPTPKEEFIPLLQPITVKAKSSISRGQNLFHGRIRAREVIQTVEPSGDETLISRIDSDGSLDRLFSKPWSLNWSGNVRYRDGNRSSTADDFHRPKAYLYRIILAGPLSKRAGLNLGRFIPFEIPGLGYVDGAKVHYKHSKDFQFGLVGGARPDRQDLGFSKDEFLASTYLSFQKGEMRKVFVSGTLGVMQTIYKGDLDQLAVLYDQRTELSRFINLSLTSQIDFNAGNAKVNKDPRLTRFDAYLTTKLFSFLGLRGSVNHFERADTAAERALSGEENLDAIRNSGSWRYSAGSQQSLPYNLSLDEDISYYKTGEELSKGFWRISLSRYGLLRLKQARITMAGFNLSPFEGEGYGGLITNSLPFKDNRLLFDLAYGFRYKGAVGQPKKYSTSDYSARMLWRANKHWDLDMGFSRVYQEGIRSNVGDLGLSYRW